VKAQRSSFESRARWIDWAAVSEEGIPSASACAKASAIRYRVRDAVNGPRRDIPMLIGGAGEQVTLKLVARYGDANNVGGGIEKVRHKEQVLVRHCETVGRNPADIERTSGLGVVVIRDSREEARRVADAIFERNGDARPWEDQPVGTAEDVAAYLEPYLEIGYHHLIAGFPSPYDEESMTRLATEVAPLLGAKTVSA
jgi:alkanesulfonate monooxygenase SsuD/methylene tetrahydromethanopterin reductase-like flavin-dependent oxidoreductase (luciferase family)